MDEYKAVKNIKIGKAAGPEGISPEVLKYCDLDETVLQFANKLPMNLDEPVQWLESNLVPIPKSGNLSQVSNYMEISLSQMMLKVVNRSRIQSQIVFSLFSPRCYEQTRMVSGLVDPAQILTLRRIIEAIRARNLPAVITFIDFRKAFDSINRRKMLQIFKAYGIPTRWVDAIGKTCEETRANILSPDGETEFLKTSTDVLQGDTVAPYLFIIALHYVLREAIEGHQERFGLTIKPG